MKTNTENELPIILVVDDEYENLEVLSVLLCDEYEVRVYTSSEDALDGLIRSSIVPDLIILDIMMPNVDGYSFCRHIKENSMLADIPVIFTTALQEDDDEQKGFEAGAVDYIKKPFSPYILKARVRTHVELKQSREVLKHFCETDALTDIHNRHYFNMIYTRELKRARRFNESVSVLMLDVDFFKKYNDRYGHPAGDECLKQVAYAIKNACHRTTDFYARYGGEEFVVLLSNSKPNEALNLAAKIHNEIQVLNITHEDSIVSNHVTVSIGCSSLHGIDIISEPILIEQADTALYEAKKIRNTTVVYSDIKSNCNV